MSTPCNIRRVDRAANIAVAIVIGLLGVAALWHWMTPCEAGSLCTLAVTPTRLNPLQRIAAWLHELRVRMLITSYENEAAHWQESIDLAPNALAHARQRIAELRVQLVQGGGTSRALR